MPQDKARPPAEIAAALIEALPPERAEDIEWMNRFIRDTAYKAPSQWGATGQASARKLGRS